MICIVNGLIHDGIHREPYVGDIWVDKGKIVRIAASTQVPGEAEVLDATGKEVYPGFVEAHGHIGLDGYGIGYEGNDYNETGDIVTPQLRAIDGIEPQGRPSI